MAATPLRLKTPLWQRLLSLPAAALGVIAFFFPWVYVGCGNIKGEISGYEFATGAWEENIGAARARRIKETLQVDRVRRIFSKDRPGDTGQTILHPEQPLLWVIPAAMVLMAGAALLGQRLLALPFAAVVAGGLGYFKYRFELELANARVPGRIDVEWLPAYWVSWASLVLLLLLVLLPFLFRRRA